MVSIDRALHGILWNIFEQRDMAMPMWLKSTNHTAGDVMSFVKSIKAGSNDMLTIIASFRLSCRLRYNRFEGGILVTILPSYQNHHGK